jgi:hypothetical protein
MINMKQRKCRTFDDFAIIGIVFGTYLNLAQVIGCFPSALTQFSSFFSVETRDVSLIYFRTAHFEALTQLRSVITFPYYLHSVWISKLNRLASRLGPFVLQGLRFGGAESRCVLAVGSGGK